MTTRISELLDLVRAPAALTVLGDSVVGATSARGVVGTRILALSTSSACLYAAGMALNDYADADLDAQERPERPIPSGRVTRNAALAVGVGLTALGVGIAFSAGRASGLVSLATAASVWSYDLAAKATPAGPAVMALCRGLDVMMGAAGSGWRRALVPAAIISAHTFGVTVLSRGEVTGTTSATAGAVVALSVTAAAAGVVGAGLHAPATMFGGVGYLTSTLPAQIATVSEPTAANARTATRQGIRSMVPLQTALVARTGSASATAGLIALGLIGRLLSTKRTKGDVT